MIKMALLCTGNIANKMAEAIVPLEEVECYAVAARDLDRAKEFAQKYGFKKAYGSYNELVEDEEVELVYVSSIHTLHYEHVKLCLEHGKHVICEKPFTINAIQSKELFELAKEKKVLLMEALWTRFLPARFKIDEILSSGIIGEVKNISASIGYNLSTKERLLNPDLAGGALLDLGVYTLNFASMILGNDIKSISSTAIMSDKGIDKQEVIVIEYKNGTLASLLSSAESTTNNVGIINGTKGYITCDNINCTQNITIFSSESKDSENYHVPIEINGFEYQVKAAIEAIKQGEIEASLMPHSETQNIMEIMDELRKSWGLVYPMEK